MVINQPKKKILVVCAANYCRSPVAAELLKAKYADQYEISSAGTIQFDRAGMDGRSLKYLKKILKKIDFHQPRKISKKMIVDSDLVYAIDFKILMDLNRIYPDLKDKFQLFKIEEKNLIIADPFNMNEEDYEDIMVKINEISSNIKINI